ncbi:branched-chain amino acid ABC transporter permease [Stutzerimonas azotifigens]|uniref:branched-chain amino acid ABC transporter permease n=1 Tax=Stutzerimonas azotifigens TaxID=291995 RepID=UPI000418AB5D|nr:branched-chain amino acid ABC transporter permease [Stutzerimonas azotifigens]
MRYRFLLLALLVVALVVVPPFLGLGWQYTLVNALIAALFAAAFNLLMGQGGMLSFGHAAYYGLGAFGVLHVMQLIEYGDSRFPTVLLPLVGGLIGLVSGLLAGFFAARRSGVYFALVTLALAQLLYSLAPHWSGMFGGEAGLSSMRMPSLGLDFGSNLQVYYLTLAWTLVCISLLYAYTLTPFGRLTQALRDNEQRVRFMGYNAHATKVLVFGISAMFAGIAGGLTAIANETANYQIFNSHVSAQVVLHTFIGGSALFFGPIIGAAVITVFTFVVSGVTHSWMLYLGALFVLVMLFAPNGIGGVIQAHVQRRDSLPWRRLVAPYAVATGALVLVALGTVFIVQSLEIVFSEQYRAAVARTGQYADYSLFGMKWALFSPLTWLTPLLPLVAGLLLLRRTAARIRELWAGGGDPSACPPKVPGATLRSRA